MHDTFSRLIQSVLTAIASGDASVITSLKLSRGACPRLRVTPGSLALSRVTSN